MDQVKTAADFAADFDEKILIAKWARALLNLNIKTSHTSIAYALQESLRRRRLR
jgi:hypothetical protein